MTEAGGERVPPAPLGWYYVKDDIPALVLEEVIVPGPGDDDDIHWHSVV